MSINRRGFMQIATAASASLPVFGQPHKRWAMVIDQQKCAKEKDCVKCIKACHKAHNVPQIPDRAHEVKWIWKERFENAFQRRERAGGARGPAGPDPLQPLRQSAVRARLPDAGHLETRRRHRDDGLAPLHRLPLLHGGLPVRLAQLQLERPAPLHRTS